MFITRKELFVVAKFSAAKVIRRGEGTFTEVNQIHAKKKDIGSPWRRVSGLEKN